MTHPIADCELPLMCFLGPCKKILFHSSTRIGSSVSEVPFSLDSHTVLKPGHEHMERGGREMGKGEGTEREKEGKSKRARAC